MAEIRQSSLLLTNCCFSFFPIKLFYISPFFGNFHHSDNLPMASFLLITDVNVGLRSDVYFNSPNSLTARAVTLFQWFFLGRHFTDLFQHHVLYLVLMTKLALILQLCVSHLTVLMWFYFRMFFRLPVLHLQISTL